MGNKYRGYYKAVDANGNLITYEVPVMLLEKMDINYSSNRHNHSVTHPNTAPVSGGFHLVVLVVTVIAQQVRLDLLVLKGL